MNRPRQNAAEISARQADLAGVWRRAWFKRVGRNKRSALRRLSAASDESAQENDSKRRNKAIAPYALRPMSKQSAENSSVPGGLQEFFRCADTAFCLECQGGWLRLPFGNHSFRFLELCLGQQRCHLVDIFFRRDLRQLEIRIR